MKYNIIIHNEFISVYSVNVTILYRLLNFILIVYGDVCFVLSEKYVWLLRIENLKNCILLDQKIRMPINFWSDYYW